MRRAQDKGAAKPSLRVTAETLSVPDGRRGQTYRPHRFTAQAGTAPYTWQAVEGLPDGMTLSAGGELGGKPAKAGSFTFQVRVTDHNGAQAVQQVRLSVGEVAAQQDDGWSFPPWVVVLVALLGLLGALNVALIVKAVIFGEPDKVVRGTEGVVNRRRRRRRY
ncbi:hypothetical protein C3488_08405 [Streptomyces sp. Ru72]|nr:hypothetical protein C3488_08405 [Streptomyces sp. Ru72]